MFATKQLMDPIVFHMEKNTMEVNGVHLLTFFRISSLVFSRRKGLRAS